MSTPEVQSWFKTASLAIFLLLLPFFMLLLKTNRARSGKSRRLPPSPPKLPLIGNLHQLGAPLHRSLHAISEKYGPLILLQLGRRPTLVVSSADMAQEIMRTHDAVFASRPSLETSRIIHYDNIDMAFAPYGEHWKKVRKICITHLLSNKMVQSFRHVRKEEVAFMIDKISEASSSLGVVHMSEVLNSFSNDVVCRVVAGKGFREEGRNETFRQLIEANAALLGAFHVGDYFPKLGWLDVFIGLNARAKRNKENWDVLLDEVIREHTDRVKDDGQKETDFVDVLLSLQKNSDQELNLTNHHIKALLNNMFAAGTDTSYIVLEWSLTELVRNPEAMKKLQDEVRGIASTGKAMVTEEELSGMSYLKAVIKETMRLHPPAPLLIPRESMEDCQIKGYYIPRKTTVFINAWGIGRDENFWESPNEFRPERFVGNPVDFRGNDFQFIPFGAGRRSCPGMNFAVANTELALANLVHRFDWELPPGMTRDELDMADSPGLTAVKTQPLNLVPKLSPY